MVGEYSNGAVTNCQCWPDSPLGHVPIGVRILHAPTQLNKYGKCKLFAFCLISLGRARIEQRVFRVDL